MQLITKKAYTTFETEQIDKEVLDLIQVNDLIKINNWRRPMRVRGVSENYAVMTCNIMGKLYYSVISKKPFEGTQYNNLRQGLYYCGPDHWLFGYVDFDYKFNDINKIEKYLDSFESGESEISQRSHTISIYTLSIKRG